MGKHVLTATNITANPINNSVAEYASVDIQYIGSNALNNPTANNDTEMNRTIYERLHLQSSQLEQPKPTSQHNNETTKKTSKSSKNNTHSYHIISSFSYVQNSFQKVFLPITYL